MVCCRNADGCQMVQPIGRPTDVKVQRGDAMRAQLHRWGMHRPNAQQVSKHINLLLCLQHRYYLTNDTDYYELWTSFLKVEHDLEMPLKDDATEEKYLTKFWVWRPKRYVCYNSIKGLSWG